MNWTLHGFAQAILVTAAFGILGIFLCGSASKPLTGSRQRSTSSEN